MKFKRLLLLSLMMILLGVPAVLRAHSFHQLQIQIVESNRSLNWKLRFPLVDFVEFNQLPTKVTLIDANYDENVQLINAKKLEAIKWIKNSLLFRKLPASKTERLINDPDFVKIAPTSPSFDSEETVYIEIKPFLPTIYIKKEVELKNFKIHCVPDKIDEYKVISHVEIEFDTVKAREDEHISISQHFLNGQFKKAIDCTVNIKKNNDKQFGYPLSLPTGTIMRLNIDKPLTATEVIIDYLQEGFFHILEGPDHLAFLLSLILIHLGFRQLLISVSLFTLAHCITLLLAGLDVLSLAPKIVEPLIAFTVAVSGFHAWKSTSKLKKYPDISSGHYWYLIVFAFGLIHGLGFSYLFREKIPEGQSIILWLLSFNVGIELGQILFLTAIFLLFKLFSKIQVIYWPLRYISAAFLLCAGTYWFMATLK